MIIELPQDWGNKTLGRHKQNLVLTRTQKKGAETPQETEPDWPTECPGVFCVGSGPGISPFEGGHHYPYHRSNYLEGTQSHPSTENWIKDSLNKTQRFPPVSLSQQEASTSLLSLPRGQTEWKPQLQKTNQTDLATNCGSQPCPTR